MLWMTYSQQILADTGEIENQVHDSSMSLDDVPEAIEARPHYVYGQPSRKSGSVKEVVQAKPFSLIIDAPEADLRSIEEFMIHASEIADTLCLLVGFLSKSPIRWFSSTCVDGNVLIERHREVKANSDEPPHWDEGGSRRSAYDNFSIRRSRLIEKPRSSGSRYCITYGRSQRASWRTASLCCSLRSKKCFHFSTRCIPSPSSSAMPNSRHFGRLFDQRF